MRALCHPFNCGELVGFWQTGSDVSNDLQIFTCDGRSRGEPSDKNFYANQVLASELFENVKGINAVFFERSAIKVLKGAHPSWYDIGEKTDHIVTEHLGRREPRAIYGRLSEADLTWPVQIRVEEHFRAPWHRVYHANRYFAEEPYFHYFLEGGKEPPEVYKRVWHIDGIGKITVNPVTCVGISLIREPEPQEFLPHVQRNITRELAPERLWPRIHRQIMDALMQFLREQDAQIKELERLIEI